MSFNDDVIPIRPCIIDERAVEMPHQRKHLQKERIVLEST
jgi:hypothetical protein